MKSLETLQSTHATFSIGKAISDGWAMVSKNLGYYILGGVLAVIIGFVAGIVPYIGGLANSIIIAPCFAAGAIFITWRISKNIPWTDLGDVFKGFKQAVPLAVSSLIQNVAMAILVVLFFFNYIPQLKELFDLSSGTNPYTNRAEIEALGRELLNGETLLLFLGLMIVLLLISIIWAFKYHFIVIYKLDAWPAMEMSRKVTTHNILPLAGLFILLGLIITISILPCGIGLLFSLPLSITALYSAFAQITGCDEVEVDNEMFDFIAEDKQ
jgi:hypothetical protein